jgi:hypothetical protein
MMNPKRNLKWFVFALTILAGCQGGDDGVNQPATTADVGAGIVRGDINSDASTFEFASKTDFAGPNPPPGPFVIRGHDARYDAELGALVFELTVINRGRPAYPEPVSLTFVQLLPAAVSVLNADNGETGPGASFDFEFADDDVMWSPDEESLPRTVQLLMEDGVALGFAARIDVGQDPLGGAIGGLVWHDVDEDGMVEGEEAGIGGASVRIEGADGQRWRATTAADGMYRFDGLPAGFYSVSILPRADLWPTTPRQIQVLLVTHEEGVSDFLVADFGCRIVETGSVIRVGDCLDAKGHYESGPDRLVAAHVERCGDRDDDCEGRHDDDDDDDDGDDEDDDKHDDASWGRLAGPVTDLDVEAGMFAIMGTWLHAGLKSGDSDDDPELGIEDLEIGDRVRVYVAIVPGEDGPRLEAAGLQRYDDSYDRVSGPVREIMPVSEGDGIEVRVFETIVALESDDFECDD